MKWMDNPWVVRILWISVSPSGYLPAFPLWTDRSESQPLSEGRAPPDRRSPRIFRAYRVIYTIIILNFHPAFSMDNALHAPGGVFSFFRHIT